ncbi:hypothetical protein [Solirubrobacter ginsenosidimutans]|uniref:hypothetical protein n=1 Tax=Solirubrobacter ginsenosidimutans TaxID=490573 RepID=UPI0022CE31C6|nr:hypothetical protein [Solirubrobacter ginsenosidimutans]
MRGTALSALGLALVFAAPAAGQGKNVQLVKTIPEGKWATAINFLEYRDGGHGHDRGAGGRTLDVMVVTGRFGVKTYSLADPTKPQLLDEISSERLKLPGDPDVDFTPDPAKDGDPHSTFWQNEDMDVDQDRKLILISRDPRSYNGTTSNEPGDPNGATNIAGVYIVDASDPEALRLLAFQQLPTGHTTTCINGCRWLWTGGPAATNKQKQPPLNWTFGRPLIATDLSDPRRPRAYPMQPIDLFRRDGVTAYSHDVQVDDAGVAWVSGDGGTRGYWTDGRHYDPVARRNRDASPLNPVPYAGGGLPQTVTNDADGGFEHNAERPIGRDAPRGDDRYKRGELLLITEEDFGPAAEGCSKQGMFSIASLKGSYNGEAWKSTKTNPFRLQVVGTWNPYKQEGSRPPEDFPLADFCSAHYFDVEGSIVSYAWYGEGTRFLDISDPAHPRQIAYWRPRDTLVWASYMHNGYVYTADHTRGIEVLKLTGGAKAAKAAKREVVAPPMSAKQRSFLWSMSSQLKGDPATAGLCFLTV